MLTLLLRRLLYISISNALIIAECTYVAPFVLRRYVCIMASTHICKHLYKEVTSKTKCCKKHPYKEVTSVKQTVTPHLCTCALCNNDLVKVMIIHQLKLNKVSLLERASITWGWPSAVWARFVPAMFIHRRACGVAMAPQLCPSTSDT